MSFADLIPPHVAGRIEADKTREDDDRLLTPAVVDPPGTVRCLYCRDVIPSPRNAYRRVHGWEKQRHEGGTNQVVLRRPTDEYACVHCITKLRDGIPIGQPTLA